MQNLKTKINNGRTPKEQIRQIIKRPKEKFLTTSQEEYWEVMEKNQITFCFGPSGTGKSYISIKKAIDLLWTEDNKYEKIIIIRPAIEAEESLGFLPGTINDKIEPYISPSFHLMEKIIGKESKEKLITEGFIEISALAFLRGRDISNSILIFEEAQNTTPSQIKLLVTRIGFNSKFFISGDIEQSDRFKDKTRSGLYDSKNRLQGIKDVGFFEFGIEDIVRNPIISELLNRYNK